MTERKAPTERLKPLPYLRWYVQDYRASRAVQRLAWEERGLYRELIDECWDKGCIPDDPPRLAEIAGCPVGIMAEAWVNIRPLFTELPGSDGMYLTSRRLEIERSTDDQERVRKVNSGRQGGLARAANAKQKLAGPSTASGHLASSSRAVAEQSNSNSSYAPADVSALMAHVAALCPFCGGVAGAHQPDCRPARLAPGP